MTILHHRSGLLRRSGLGFASFVMNGSDEYLQKTNVSISPSQTIATISFWIKLSSFSGIEGLFSSNLSSNGFNVILDNADNSFRVGQSGGGLFGEGALGLTIPNDTWEHWVVRLDSTSGTSDNRIRLYQNGNLRTDNGDGPLLNEVNTIFANGHSIRIGYDFLTGNTLNGKIAFIDVLEGISNGPGGFAVDDGGTWTAAGTPFPGYGTYGFRLDGSDGFNDVSGNGQHFTGNNMDESNLDFDDLPPYFT